MIQNCPGMGDYAKVTTKIVGPESSVKDRIFDQKERLQPMKLQTLDIPFVYG